MAANNLLYKLRLRREPPLFQSPAHELPPPAPMHILLTGSTGNLGSYILSSLLSYPPSTISHITCLNRSPTASTRQQSAHTTRNLTTDFSRCTFLTASLSSPTLGLSPSDYHHLSQTVTHILHNAWPVDFNLSFSSFAPSIQGVANLIDFAHSSPHNINFFFISSVSVVGRWSALPGATAKVPEVVLEDWRMAKMGYDQSKLVSERLLVQASERLGMKIGIVRVGQVAGLVEADHDGGDGGGGGSWNEKEWLPSLVKSSIYLNKVPRELGPMERVDWVPVDVCGRVIGEIVVAAEDKQRRKRDDGLVKVYHIANPNESTWNGLLSVVVRNLPEGDKLDPVGFSEWVDALKQSTKRKQAGDDMGEKNPAAKLITFFEELQDKAVRFPKARAALLDTRHTMECSESLAKLAAVNEHWMEIWMKQWAFN